MSVPPVRSQIMCWSPLSTQTNIGHLQTVKTVYVASVGQMNRGDRTKPSTHTVSTEDSDKSERKKPAWWDPLVDLSHLNKEQKRITKQLLREECHAFAHNDDDIGTIPSHHVA